MIESTWFKTFTSLNELKECFRSHLAEHSIYDLSITQAYILAELYARNAQHATELARAVGALPTSFTPVLDVLEKRKLIARNHDPKDRRAILICLTAKGRVYGETVTVVHEQVEAEYRK